MINFSKNGSPHIELEIAKSRFQKNQNIGFNGVPSAKSFLKKISSEFELCPTAVGLDPICLHSQNGCPNGCIALENVQEYNEKITIALNKYSLKNKTMALVDRGRKLGEHSLILIKNGRLQGFGYAELNHQINNIHILESIITPMSSDENTTFIVESYLRKNSRLKVLELTPTV